MSADVHKHGQPPTGESGGNSNGGGILGSIDTKKLALIGAVLAIIAIIYLMNSDNDSGDGNDTGDDPDDDDGGLGQDDDVPEIRIERDPSDPLADDERILEHMEVPEP